MLPSLNLPREQYPLLFSFLNTQDNEFVEVRFKYLLMLKRLPEENMMPRWEEFEWSILLSVDGSGIKFQFYHPTYGEVVNNKLLNIIEQLIAKMRTHKAGEVPFLGPVREASGFHGACLRRVRIIFGTHEQGRGVDFPDIYAGVPEKEWGARDERVFRDTMPLAFQFVVPELNKLLDAAFALMR